MDNLSEIIIEHERTAEVIREDLRHKGPTLIVIILDCGLSLRKMAACVGLSATYLSRIYNGHLIMSPSTYVKLDKLLDSLTEAKGDSE